YFRLIFSIQIPGTSPVDVFYFLIYGQITDYAGNFLQNIGHNDAIEIDLASPVIIEAFALEAPPGANGPDNGDTVTITFSEKTNTPAITGANIDSILALSGGHVWTDGTGKIKKALWDNKGLALTVTFSDDSGQATITSGDFITPDNLSITDASGNAVSSPATLEGTLDLEWIKYIGYSPPGLGWSTAVYDPVMHRMVMFGGVRETSMVTVNDVWELRLAKDREKWRRLATGGTPPPPMYGHAAIYDEINNRMIVFGGDNGNDWTSNSVYALDLTCGSESWSKIMPSGPELPGAHSHYMVYDDVRNRALIFGGHSELGPFDNVWEITLAEGFESAAQVQTSGDEPWYYWELAAIFDSTRKHFVITGEWTEQTYSLDVSSTVDTVFPWSILINQVADMRSPAAVYDEASQRMVVLGNYDSGAMGSYAFAAHASSLVPGQENWYDINPSGGRPEPREAFVTVYDPIVQRAVMFGGYSWSFGMIPYMSDTWELSLLGSQEMFRPLRFPGHPPLARGVCQMTHDPINNRMLVYGGADAANMFNDIWAFDLTPGEESWKELHPFSGDFPDPLGNYVFVTDADRSRVILWGGISPFGGYPTDTFFFDISGADNGSWTSDRGMPMIPRPAGRELAVGVIDSANNRFVIYGGNDGSTTYTDVWAQDLDTGLWTDITPAGPSPIINVGKAIFDPINQSMVFVGGGQVYRLDLSNPGSESWYSLGIPGTPTVGNFSLVYSPGAHTVFLFGGHNAFGIRTNKAYELDLTVGGETWSPVSFPNTPGVRSHHASGYDATSGRVVVFGGFGGLIFRDDTWWVYY
ncbi:MAG: Kelch repeat-containing protein, partial [Planctomycetota bacterium]